MPGLDGDVGSGQKAVENLAVDAVERHRYCIPMDFLFMWLAFIVGFLLGVFWARRPLLDEPLARPQAALATSSMTTPTSAASKAIWAKLM